MRIAVLTFEGFNELDSFIAAAMLNRVKRPALKALIVCPTAQVASMNGVVVHSQAPLRFAREADAVIVGSGVKTRELVRDQALMGELRLDPKRQIIGAQCSGCAGARKTWPSRRCAGVHRYNHQNRGYRKPASRFSTSRSSRTAMSQPRAVASARTTLRRGRSRVLRAGGRPKRWCITLHRSGRKTSTWSAPARRSRRTCEARRRFAGSGRRP